MLRRMTQLGLSALALLLYAAAASADVPYRPLAFPADHAGHMSELEAHPFLVEWWYFAGDLESTAGEQLAFSAGIFDMKQTSEEGVVSHNYWVLFSVTDVDAEVYHFTIPSGYYPASDVFISEKHLDINYADAFVLEQRRCKSEFTFRGQAVSAAEVPVAVDLRLVPKAPPLLHSTDQGETLGIVDMRDGGNSYYYSLTDLVTRGTVTIGDETYRICGRKSTTWFDHQWGDFLPNATHGYNWFAVRLDNGLRGMVAVDVARGTFEEGVEWVEENDPRSVLGGFATFKLPNGDVTHLTLDDTFALNRSNYWQGFSGNIYPLNHLLSFDALGLEMDIRAVFENQDQGGYEGVCTVDATYLEMPVWGTAQLEIGP